MNAETMTSQFFMSGQSLSAKPAVSSKARLAGRILSGLAGAFLLFDGVMKLVQPRVVIDSTHQLGYLVSVILPLGIVLTACTLLYLIPRTAVLGSILLTGYLGGAVATHLRVSDPLFSHVLFPVYVGALLWAGLWLRDLRLRRVLSSNE
jgi:hypothetical protein